jgi:hypothetical protein
MVIAFSLAATMIGVVVVVVVVDISGFCNEQRKDHQKQVSHTLLVANFTVLTSIHPQHSFHDSAHIHIIHIVLIVIHMAMIIAKSLTSFQ